MKTYIEHRPWGKFILLAQVDTHWIKQIEVHPLKKLSYQKHEDRYEVWVVVDGEGWVTMDEGVQIRVGPGDTVEIFPNELHRIQNDSEDKTLVFVEVAYTYKPNGLREDDIIRVEDDYGRN